ncbi:MAG TPA: ABC transporter permease [Actinophytocola sp.]|uniref:ABC transporter permease n=1 Tax=Actinophytocola sp. TaxID=1872138 RepID=UPI002DBCD4F8|nr:ABC transporter permease [Actinophytocola sp.]HEU5475193.1 ABC transporter permease [Actinophytocola sp.]
MWWLTWRQHRSQILVTAGLLTALGVFLLINGLTADGLATGRPNLVRGDHFAAVYNVIGWMALAPALIGLFWGTPVLGREFERGTHRLAWTQSVSLRRWLAVKLGLLGALVALAGLALGAMVGAWLSVYRGLSMADRFGNPGLFVLTGVVPAAWWLFAFMTGVAAGAVCRRIMPAIAVTVAVLLTIILAMFFYNVRGHYAPAERAVVEVAPSTGEMFPSDWFLLDIESTSSDAEQVIRYHPADRYWRFQWTETGLLLIATIVLGGVAVTRATRSRN